MRPYRERLRVILIYKNSSGDEIANVNFFYDDIAHVEAYFKIPKKITYFV